MRSLLLTILIVCTSAYSYAESFDCRILLGEWDIEHVERNDEIGWYSFVFTAVSQTHAAGYVERVSEDIKLIASLNADGSITIKKIFSDDTIYDFKLNKLTSNETPVFEADVDGNSPPPWANACPCYIRGTKKRDGTSDEPGNSGDPDDAGASVSCFVSMLAI